jgi:hypothetical protein
LPRAVELYAACYAIFSDGAVPVPPLVTNKRRVISGALVSAMAATVPELDNLKAAEVRLVRRSPQ